MQPVRCLSLWGRWGQTAGQAVAATQQASLFQHSRSAHSASKPPPALKKVLVANRCVCLGSCSCQSPNRYAVGYVLCWLASTSCLLQLDLQWSNSAYLQRQYSVYTNVKSRTRHAQHAVCAVPVIASSLCAQGTVCAADLSTPEYGARTNICWDAAFCCCPLFLQW